MNLFHSPTVFSHHKVDTLMLQGTRLLVFWRLLGGLSRVERFTYWLGFIIGIGGLGGGGSAASR